MGYNGHFVVLLTWVWQSLCNERALLHLAYFVRHSRLITAALIACVLDLVGLQATHTRESQKVSYIWE